MKEEKDRFEDAARLLEAALDVPADDGEEDLARANEMLGTLRRLPRPPRVDLVMPIEWLGSGSPADSGPG
jgi:hypothetical protein